MVAVVAVVVAVVEEGGRLGGARTETRCLRSGAGPRDDDAAAGGGLAWSGGVLGGGVLGGVGLLRVGGAGRGLLRGGRALDEEDAEMVPLDEETVPLDEEKVPLDLGR